MISEPTTTSTDTVPWSEETIVDLIRKMRNDLIKDFLDERFLLEYLSGSYRVRELNNVKLELIKHDLKEMLINPVNVAHYAPLINLIRETGSASLSSGNEELFYKEIESILKRFLY